MVGMEIVFYLNINFCAGLACAVINLGYLKAKQSK